MNISRGEPAERRSLQVVCVPASIAVVMLGCQGPLLVSRFEARDLESTHRLSAEDAQAIQDALASRPELSGLFLRFARYASDEQCPGRPCLTNAYIDMRGEDGKAGLIVEVQKEEGRWNIVEVTSAWEGIPIWTLDPDHAKRIVNFLRSVPHKPMVSGMGVPPHSGSERTVLQKGYRIAFIKKCGDPVPVFLPVGFSLPEGVDYAVCTECPSNDYKEQYIYLKETPAGLVIIGVCDHIAIR